jgi:hypothetical protein
MSTRILGLHMLVVKYVIVFTYVTPEVMATIFFGQSQMCKQEK